MLCIQKIDFRFHRQNIRLVPFAEQQYREEP